MRHIYTVQDTCFEKFDISIKKRLVGMLDYVNLYSCPQHDCWDTTERKLLASGT